MKGQFSFTAGPNRRSEKKSLACADAIELEDTSVPEESRHVAVFCPAPSAYIEQVSFSTFSTTRVFAKRVPHSAPDNPSNTQAGALVAASRHTRIAGLRRQTQRSGRAAALQNFAGARQRTVMCFALKS